MRSGPLRSVSPSRWPLVVVPLVAALVVLPLLLHGPSCGHDYTFHLQSWIEVAADLRHGELLPSWAPSPAYNAGEPRFVFYPPLSWLLGGLLVWLFPGMAVPTLFSLVALVLAGWGMYALARRFATPNGALLVSALYLSNPYMLFTAYERTAFAELLAAAWLPWLLREALAPVPRVLALAVPIALLWLTNAPAAVMGTYTLMLISLLRFGLSWRAARRDGEPFTAWCKRQRNLLLVPAGGLALGLALSAFYLLPAAFERRYVEIAMAIIPNMRVEDNFLFGHTGYGPHDHVLHTASLVAMGLLGLTVLALLAAWLTGRGRSNDGVAQEPQRASLPVLALVTVVVGVLLFRITQPIWHVVPELMFLQFPWRWLAVLGCVFGAVAAVGLGAKRLPTMLAVSLSLGVAALAGFLAVAPFRQGCEVNDSLPARLALFTTHHGVGPTDEYTPKDADNDQLRWDDPAWWLTDELNGPGPHTVPNPAATILDYDQPPPLEQTISGQAPHHLQVTLRSPQELVLNLRAYPAWQITVNGHSVPLLQRDDGLVAMALPAGTSDVDVRWRRLPDVWVGDGVSLAALGVFLWVFRKSRRIKPQE